MNYPSEFNNTGRNNMVNDEGDQVLFMQSNSAFSGKMKKDDSVQNVKEITGMYFKEGKESVEQREKNYKLSLIENGHNF